MSEELQFAFAWNTIPMSRYRIVRWLLSQLARYRMWEAGYQSVVVFASPQAFAKLGREAIEGLGRGAGVVSMCGGHFLFVPTPPGEEVTMRDRFQISGPTYVDKYNWLADTWKPLPEPKQKEEDPQ